MTVPSETFSATAAESALRPCSDLVCGRPARLRGSTPSIKTPSLQSYHPPCIIASCGSNTGVWPQRHHDLYSSLLRYVNIHHYCDMYHYSHRLCQVHVLPGHGTNALATDLEERGVRAVDQPARNIIIPGHHLRYVCIPSLFINKSDLLIEMSNQEYPSMSQGGPSAAHFSMYHHRAPQETLAPHHLFRPAPLVATGMGRPPAGRLGIMGIVAAIIITCDMYIFIPYLSSGDMYRYVYIHPDS